MKPGVNLLMPPQAKDVNDDRRMACHFWGLGMKIAKTGLFIIKARSQ